MNDLVRIVDIYKTPTEEIRKNRIKFYCLRKKAGETIANWMNRVQNSIDCCKYPMFMIEFLLIDRFICGLINTEATVIQSAKTWSLERIVECFLEQNDDDAANVTVKSELNDDDEHHTNSPDAKNQDEEHLLIEADRVMETQTGFTAVQSRMSAVSEEKYEINQEIAIDDIKCEFEDYEYSTNDGMVYETIDDANISTTSYQPNSNDDGTMDSTQSSDVESFNCTECDEIHTDQKSLDAHRRIVHNEAVIYKCPHCFTEFPEYNELLEHFNIHIGLKRYKCRLCSKWFLYTHELPKHMKKEHNKKYRIACLNCGRTLQNNQIFITHYRIRHMKNDGEYDCCLCNKSFTVPHKFTRHLQMVHQKGHLYSCKVCGKNLSSCERLQSHLLVHTGERPYECDRCNKSYTVLSTLKKHQRVFHSYF